MDAVVMTMRDLMMIVEGKVLAPYVAAGPLFHGTDMISAGAIMADGRLLDGGDQGGDLHGISLTTAFGAARSFAADRSHNMLHEEAPEWDYMGAVFVFDSLPVKGPNARLHHYEDSGNDDENEIRAFTNGKGFGLSALVAIHADLEEIDHIIGYLRTTNRLDDNPHQNIPRLLALRAHPLMRAWSSAHYGR